MGHLDIAHLLHSFLAIFLLLEQLSLSGDITSVALRGHVLSERFDGFAGDNSIPNCSLDSHIKLLTVDGLAQALTQHLTSEIRSLLMNDH